MEDEEEPILRTETWHGIQMPLSAKTKSSPVSSTGSTRCSNCVFSRGDYTNLESAQRSKSAMKLFGLIFFSVIAIVVEIIGGLRSNSLAVITDAAHLLTDVGGFSISLFSIWVSGWEATSQQSFGYKRLEVLGALVSVQLIWLICGMLIYEAVDRILGQKTMVDGMFMFATAAFGFILNLFMVLWLGHDHSHHHHGHSHHCHSHQYQLDYEHEHEHEKGELCAVTKEGHVPFESTSQEKSKFLNINLQGAYLHAMTDMIQSMGVMIAGAVLWVKPNWFMVDLICTLVFSVLALCTTFSMLSNIFGILMERSPRELNVESLKNDLKDITGVVDLHDLHVWSITVGKVVMSCHVVADPGVCSSELMSKIRAICEKRYNILHVTIQIE